MNANPVRLWTILKGGTWNFSTVKNLYVLLNFFSLLENSVIFDLECLVFASLWRF